MCQLNLVVRLLIFAIYDEVHQSLITHQQYYFFVTANVCFLFFISCIFISDDARVHNNIFQVVSGYLIVPKFIL